MGRPSTRRGTVTRPNLLPGVLHDVWFLPDGRKREREKIGVTVDPDKWDGGMGWLKLDTLVRERFACLDDAKRAKLQVTSRPDEEVLVEIRWQP